MSEKQAKKNSKKVLRENVKSLKSQVNQCFEDYNLEKKTMNIQKLTGVLAMALLPILPAKSETLYVLSTADQIISFDSASPGNLLSARGITGLQSGESLLGIDYRPSSGTMYGLGSSSRIYTIDPNTGGASVVGSGQFTPLLNGITFGFDFNPVADRIRISSDFDQNLRAHPDLGTVVATDGTITYAAGDPFFGQNPKIDGVAYNNSFPGAGSTILYGIDSLLNTLVTIGSPSPNDGTVHTVGALGFDVSRFNGFDISGLSGIAFLASPAASSDPGANLYEINFVTGVATLRGKIGDADTDILVRGMTAFYPVPEPGIAALLAFGGGFGAFILWRRRRS